MVSLSESEYLPLCSVYFLHDSSLGVCFADDELDRQAPCYLHSFVFGHLPLNGAEPCLVRFGGENGQNLKCRFNLEKIRMDYSCHGRYKGIHIVFS